MKIPGILLLVLMLCLNSKIEANTSQEKVLICGVCRNILNAVYNTIKNIEALGSRFEDYRVIIYENDSVDHSEIVLDNWAQKNERVVFISEKLSPEELELSRIERISHARNKVLDLARDPQYADYMYLVMVDLDFTHPWPIDEIMDSLNTPIEWDCITANGTADGVYWDRYAFRDSNYPLGDELLGHIWWCDLHANQWFSVEGEEWLPVYSAFGGLAIYKTATITQFNYSAKISENLRKFYQAIFPHIPLTNLQVQRYLEVMGRMVIASQKSLKNIPIIFKEPICCEHINLHASMYLRGYNRVYVNPKMRMIYK